MATGRDTKQARLESSRQWGQVLTRDCRFVVFTIQDLTLSITVG